MADNSIFRKESLDRLDRPEQLGDSITVTTPSVYVILLTIAILIMSVVTWGVLGSITDKVTLGGVVFPADGTTTVTLPNRGTVRSLFVHDGDQVDAGSSLAMVSVDEAYSMISSPVKGTVLAIKDENKDFEAFEPIVTIIKTDTTTLVSSMVVFAPFEVARQLREGMDVEVTPKNLTREKDGYVRGKVRSVSKYPVTKEDAVKKLRLETLAMGVFPEQGAVFEVEVELNVNNGKLEWSFESDEEADMSIGTFCNVQIITKRRSVYQYMFETVRGKARELVL